ncbi:hypothetical protein V8C37DRAFT_364409 [Trichoderma ceciliae]
MSGIEIAGIVLRAFPLIISGLEHWHDVTRVGNSFWQVQKEYNKCLIDMKFHEICYKRNLKSLLLPIVNDPTDVDRLVNDPGGTGWSDQILQERLEDRLQESYALYMEIIYEMNEKAQELVAELSIDNPSVPSKLVSKKQGRFWSLRSLSKSFKPLSRISWSKLDFEIFRLKFSVRGLTRDEVVAQLKEYNERLEKLLSTSYNVSAHPNTAPLNTERTNLEMVTKRVWKKSDILFKALQNAWQCTCQEYHVANLRLEHRNLQELSFEVIFTFTAPSPHTSAQWAWKELKCVQMVSNSCPRRLLRPSINPPSTQSSPGRITMSTKPRRSQGKRKVTFSSMTLPTPRNEIDLSSDSSVRLCQLLGDEVYGECIGVIGNDDETYHLHPFTKRKFPGNNNNPLTLDHILSNGFEGTLSRRQRYFIALLLASSVAQLQFTAWLKTDMTKKDIFFFPSEDDDYSIPYYEPFICQSFPQHYPETSNPDVKHHNFFFLGILLLELCFGRRLEDDPRHIEYSIGVGENKQKFDLVVALDWVKEVSGEAGDDYASAVKWCFTGTNCSNHLWRREIIKNVIRPLEMCQEHFKAADDVKIL